jgi:hypothetical protein
MDDAAGIADLVERRILRRCGFPLQAGGGA